MRINLAYVVFYVILYSIVKSSVNPLIIILSHLIIQQDSIL
jgi:hypothetical protein